MGIHMKKMQIFTNSNKEFLSYVFWGASTTAVNLILYHIFNHFMNYKMANFIAILLCKVYAYIVNKFFVFKNRTIGIKALLKEIIRYIYTRGATGIIDFFGVIFLVELGLCSENVSKYIITGLVIVLNYILGKKIVFIKETKE